MDYQDINAKTIDRWVESGWEWGKPISHEDFIKAKNGEWNVLLTPTKYVPHEWFGDLKGKKLLGLASGGAQQMPVFAAIGADCTVLDYSIKQLESEEIMASKEGYKMEIIRADMSKPLPFEDESFDIIFHPVSNVYVEDVHHIWRECYRILKKGGILLSGLDNGLNFVYDNDETKMLNTLPFNPLKNKDHMKLMEEEDGGIEFSHDITEQIGGQLKAGFTLVDIYGDTNGYGNLHEHNVDTFWATKAIK